MRELTCTARDAQRVLVAPRNHGRVINRCVMRTAFTLVEMLVVIAIIGILVSLLLPAVQASRESARRVECGNHLKQMGLAFHLHHDAHEFLPSGGWNWNLAPSYVNGSAEVGGAQKAGWGFQILPYIEEKTVVDAGPVVAIATPMSTFFCPSRRSPQIVTVEDDFIPPLKGSGLPLDRALCDYAASNREQTGALRRFRPKRLADAIDGLSMSLLVGEKRLNRRFLGQPQHDDNEGYTAGWNSDTVCRTTREPLPDFNGVGDGDERFGSSHPGIVQFVFLDGSVQSIAYTVDRLVFEYLGSISDGQSISGAF